MSRIKLFLLSVFAVLALSAMASASASAFSYLIEGKALAANESIASTGGPATLVSTGAGVEIICEKALGTGVIEPTGLSTYHIEFTECRVVKPANCKVHEPILVAGVDHLRLSPILLDQFLPGLAGGVFVELTFLNNGGTCSLAGAAQPVSGSAGGIIVGGETSKVTNELEFTNSSSELSLAGVKANFKLKQSLTLSGANKGKSWSAMMN